ncbi:hypothetical protein X777_15460, partial [Ooceraea biroi]
RPNPGHKARVLGCAFTMLANVPKVVKRVVASVLLTDLTVVRALTNCKKYLLCIKMSFTCTSTLACEQIWPDMANKYLLMRCRIAAFHDIIRWFVLVSFVGFNDLARIFRIPCQHYRHICQNGNSR